MAFKNHATLSTTVLATTVSPDVTGLVSAGDVIIQVANMGGGGGATIGWSSGFNAIGSLANANISCSWGTNTGGIKAKIAAGTETTLANTSNVSDFLTSTCVIFSGRTGTPFATVAPVQQNTGSSALPVSYSIATGSPNVPYGTDILLIVPTQSQAILGETLGFTAPSGWTLGGTDYAKNPPTSTDTQGSPSICWAYYPKWPGGALPANLTGTITNSGGHVTAYTAYLVFMDPVPIVFPAQETQSTGGSGTSVSLAFTQNQVVGNSNHVVVRALTSTSFSVTDTQGNTYTQRGPTLNDGAGGHSWAQFTCDNVSAGANTVTATCSPSGTFIALWIREIGFTGGFDTHAEQIQASSSSSTADAITSGLANPNFSPGLVSGFTNAVIANPPALSAGSGFTSDGSPWGAGNSISQHRRYISANAIASTTTESTTDTTSPVSFAALFKETGAVAGKSLTGLTATYSQGPGSRSVSYATTAQTITSTEGTISEALTLTLGGQTATFGEGNLLNSINLTGQTATFASGTLTKFISGDVTTSLSGISASFSEGNLALSLGYILDSNLIVIVGQTATFAQGQITATISPAITAQTITSTEGSISAGTSTGPTYTLSSLSAVFVQGNITASVAGNVSTQLLGQTATFTEGSLTDAYDYSITGLTLTSTEGVITFSVSGDVTFQINGQTIAVSQGLMALAFPGGMPNLIGLNYYEALLVMQQAGVYAPQKIGYFGTFPITARWIPSVQPPETVLAQSVAAGTTFKVNMPITLTLSEFPVSVALP